MDLDDDDYADTLALLRAEQVAKKTSETITPKIAEMDRREQLRQSEPMVLGQQVNAARAFWDAFAEQGVDADGKPTTTNAFGKILDERGEIVRTEIDRLRGEDPNREIAFQVAERVEAFAGELHRLTLTDSEGNPLYPYNPKIPTHQFIADFIADKEAAMQALPAEQQLDEHGRKFVTADEFHAMTPHRQRYYWHFTDAQLSHIFAVTQAEQVKAMMQRENEKFEKTATARGYAKTDAAGKPAAPAAPAAAPTPPASAPKVESPAGLIEPRLAPNPGRSRNSNENATTSFVNRWLGRN